MNKQFKLAPLALAVASLCFATTSVANQGGDGHHGKRGHHEGAKISKHVSVHKHVKYHGDVAVTGRIRVDSLGMAVIDDEQDSDYNTVDNTALDNNATVDGNAMREADGNLGLNVTAGDNNVQGNSAALAAADASFVFGSSDAEIFVDQNAESNYTTNWGNNNNATMGGESMRNAAGNIGVNIAAGNSNVQKNAFAGAVASGSMGEATVAVKQETENNMTSNVPLDEVVTTRTRVSISGGLDGTYDGSSQSGSYNGSSSGTYAGTSDQYGDVYPDIWENSQNEFGDDGQHELHDNNVIGIFGHIDLDTETEGGSDLNNDGGALAFNESGDWSGDESGHLDFTEAGDVSLSGSFSGVVVHRERIYIRSGNDAHLGDDALRSATGNIGVNIAAGTNNLQNNSLAISSLERADDIITPPGGGGGE